MNVMHKRTNTVHITPDNLAQLKSDCAYAKAEGFDAFIFEGHPLLVGFAEYLILHLEQQFGGIQ